MICIAELLKKTKNIFSNILNLKKIAGKQKAIFFSFLKGDLHWEQNIRLSWGLASIQLRYYHLLNHYCCCVLVYRYQFFSHFPIILIVRISWAAIPFIAQVWEQVHHQ